MFAGPVSPSLQYAASNGTSKGTSNSAHSRPQIADATGVTTLMWAARAGHEVTSAARRGYQKSCSSTSWEPERRARKLARCAKG